MRKKLFGHIGFTLSVITAMSLLSLTPAQAAVAGNAINTNSRAAVSDAYKKRWVPTRAPGVGWTGKVTGCKAGTQSPASLSRARDAINFYRGLNGLDAVALNRNLNSYAQQAALAMQANNKMTHDIIRGMKCYTRNASIGAATSNILSSGRSWPFRDMGDTVRIYMNDHGSNNTAVGHRRWLLAPTATQVGIGTTTNYNAMNTMLGEFSEKRKKPEFFGFPNAGYSPIELEPYGRWSVTASNLSYSFHKATVTVKDSKGRKLPVVKYPVQDGYAYNTIVFKVSGIKYPVGSAVSAYTVEVNNVKHKGKTLSYKYTTKLFQGSKPK